MDCLEKLEAVAADGGGIITTRGAGARGVSRAVLSRLAGKGEIIRIAQGQYIMADDLEDELLSLSLRSANLAFSHETALWLHGISDRTPFFHAVTVPTGKAPSGPLRRDCKVYYIRPELFGMGRTLLRTQWGNLVPSYDLERTVCDCVRSRNRMGTETFLAALRLYAERRDKNQVRLWEYADRMGITRVAFRYLETLL